MAEDVNRQFEERLRSLISQKTDGGETTGLVNKIEVEQIGEELGMTSAEANTNFFTLKGSVWDVQNMDNSLIDSDESRALPPPRNWLGINDVYLVT
jgi:VIT1/CCC1 family predicted Fe2+/Mn2+ transporter